MDLQILIQVAFDDWRSAGGRDVAPLPATEFARRCLALSSALIALVIELHWTRVRHIRWTDRQIIPLSDFCSTYARHKR